MSDPRPGAFFHHFADTFDSLYEGQRGPVWRFLDDRFRSDIRLRFEGTFERLGDLTGKRVLDVGCGSGVYLREALARGARQAVGMDAAPRMLELAEKRLEKAGFADRYDLLHGLFPDDRPLGTFDHAIVMGVMDYVAEPIGFLRALAGQVTASAVVSFPSVHWLRSPLRRVRYKLRRCPLFLYRERDIVSTLERAGLESQEIQKIPGAGMDFVVTLPGTAGAGRKP